MHTHTQTLECLFRTGVLGGILLCLSIGVAEAFTLYVISKMAERYQVTGHREILAQRSVLNYMK